MKLNRHKFWSCAVASAPADRPAISPGEWRFEKVFASSALSLLPHSVTCMADPFFFRRDGRLFLFAERKLRGEHGVIVCTSTADLKNWTPPEEVLREPFHLSFPYVFRYGDEIYLLPECCKSKSLRLYRFTDFPRRCSLVRSMFEGETLVDSSIIEYDGSWYLFTTAMEVNGDAVNYELRLYCADSPNGAWQRHPASPITTDPGSARNGGAIFRFGGRLIRPAQNCRCGYGGDLSLFEIDELSREKFREHPAAENIYRGVSPLFAKGGHHLNYCDFQGRSIFSCDGAGLEHPLNPYISAFWAACRRLTGKKS